MISTIIEFLLRSPDWDNRFHEFGTTDTIMIISCVTENHDSVPVSNDCIPTTWIDV